MSSGEQEIVCRSCKETIDIEAGSCPHCGTDIRNTTPYIVGAGFGALMTTAAVFSPGQLLPFAVLGLLLIAIAGVVLYDKRQRIRRAAENRERVVG